MVAIHYFILTVKRTAGPVPVSNVLVLHIHDIYLLLQLMPPIARCCS